MDIPLRAMVGLFACLLMAGLALLLPLHGRSFQKLLASSLFIKTVMWIPIFAGFVAVLYVGNWGRLGIILLILALALRELARHRSQRSLLRWYAFGFIFCGLQVPTAYLVLDPQFATDFLVTVCFASALSDVTAFFAGKYAGRHHLPAQFNSRKSWEGVAGQVAGALLGVLLLGLAGIPHIAGLWPVIGLGTAAGDLANSYVKRRLAIDDWGNSIPGHGGYLDRFASLFAGIALSFYAYFFFG